MTRDFAGTRGEIKGVESGHFGHNNGVIARLDRAIQYSVTGVLESIGRGLLDAPPSRGMTAAG